MGDKKHDEWAAHEKREQSRLRAKLRAKLASQSSHVRSFDVLRQTIEYEFGDGERIIEHECGYLEDRGIMGNTNA